MKTRTLRALKASIRHWERHANGKARPGEGINCRHCELCKLFLAKQPFPNPKDCQKCPVRLKTGRRNCERTPWRNAARQFHINRHSIEFRKAAAKELAFLKSLLPNPNSK